ncbi:MAG: putative Ig domain-containing protein, partial [Vitreoscilla sp.]
PSGLTVDSAGTVKWAAPVAGTYSFTATARTAAGKSDSGAYTLTIASAASVSTSNHAPTLASVTLSEKAAKTFSAQMSGKDVDGGVLSYTKSGGPSGLTLTSSGVLYWVSPVKGTYSVTVTVHDNKGATGSAVITLKVA